MKRGAARALGDAGRARSPRDRRRCRWVLLAPLVPLIIIDIAFVTVSMLSDPSPKELPWAAVPGPLSPAAETAAARSCLERLTGPRPSADTAGLEGVLAEDRGGLTAVLMRGSGRYGMCVGGPGDPLLVSAGAAGRLAPADHIVLDGTPGQTQSPARFRVAYGQVGPDVTRVVITTSDSRLVVASISAGHYLAWWPSGADPVAITAFAQDGRIVDVLRPAAPPR